MCLSTDQSFGKCSHRYLTGVKHWYTTRRYPLGTAFGMADPETGIHAQLIMIVEADHTWLVLHRCHEGHSYTDTVIRLMSCVVISSDCRDFLVFAPSSITNSQITMGKWVRSSSKASMNQETKTLTYESQMARVYHMNDEVLEARSTILARCETVRTKQSK